MKKFLAVVLSVMMVLSVVTPVMAEGDISVFLDGEQLVFDVQPTEINDRVLVPVRVIFEALGAIVDWDDETQTVLARKGETIIVLQIDNTLMMVNDTQVTLDVPATEIGGRTLVPVRAISEAFGVKVDWDDSTKSVILDSSEEVVDANVYEVSSLDLSLWKNTSPLAIVEIEDGAIKVTPDENESTVFAFNQPLTSDQSMKFNFTYTTVGDWQAMATRHTDPKVIPTRCRGYFFVIKDDLIEFQKYQEKGKGEIVAMIPNDGQVKSGETYEFEVGSVNVEGGVLSTLKVNGETVLEYMDTEDPIYDEGYFAFYIHKTLGPVSISPVK
ncbi:MAG: hypothetical protein IKV86_01860 [Clostridia bacterium]|nr:hypothetical protein [Clostridia bacterium]